MKERVGQELLIPLLWFGDDPSAIPFDTLEPPYILKSSHASVHAIIVENKASLDETAIRETARSWLAWNHGMALYATSSPVMPIELTALSPMLTMRPWEHIAAFGALVVPEVKIST